MADTRQRFMDVWPTVRDEAVQYLKDTQMPEDAVEYYKRNLDYNVPGGKLNRGLSVIDSAKAILQRDLDETEFKRAAFLGWSVELLQAFFLVADDLMDGSITRRGQPCWYKQEDVGVVAINDSFLLQAAIFSLLKKHFRSQPYYVDLLELFNDVTLQTEIGQLLDLRTAPEDVVNLSNFSLRKHELIVIYKTAYYSFYLPVALAMLMTGITDAQEYENAKKILVPLGIYFQIQDDYLDAFADPSVLGKIGTDIRDNKCSWNINKAIELATPEQRAILDENYGKKDDVAEERVKQVFRDVDLPGHYERYEANVVAEIKQNIENLISTSSDNSKPTLHPDVFYFFLNKIYKRSK